MSAPGRCALGTMHGKERAFAPALTALGLEVVVPSGLDTDAWGTFTGEVPRPGVSAALRAKARAALELVPGAEFAAASEGTFGPHPQLPLLTAGIEHVLLWHPPSGVEALGCDVTLETNAASREVSSWEAAREFAEQVGFPSHALIVRARGERAPVLGKGLVEPDALRAAVEEGLSAGGAVQLESDLRAHLNPTRMRSIARAAEDAARRWLSRCPACQRPGFGCEGVEPGLPCEDCGTPTELARARVFRCAGCAVEERRPREDGITAADPGCCPRCNP